MKTPVHILSFNKYYKLGLYRKSW